jgi:hypothetical protein
MKPRTFLPLVLAIILISTFSASAFAEAKAYEVVKYKGKVGSMVIAFDYANGYVDASEVRVTETGKTIRFRLDGSGEMHFVPDKKAGAEKKIILKLGVDDAPPTKIEGSYISVGRTTAFVLEQK